MTYPLMRSLPQVVFTAAFLKCPTPAVVCSRILSAAIELCSSVLPSNLVKRELEFSIALSLDFLNKEQGQIRQASFRNARKNKNKDREEDCRV